MPVFCEVSKFSMMNCKALASSKNTQSTLSLLSKVITGSVIIFLYSYLK